jgi:hypothetical protein
MPTPGGAGGPAHGDDEDEEEHAHADAAERPGGGGPHGAIARGRAAASLPSATRSS